jgi:superfamily II DNA or RNA helicase
MGLPDLSSVRTRGGDYEERALADAVDRTVLVGNIVDHWLRLAQGIRTVVFAVSIAHSRHIVERFQQAGVAAEHLDGTTPTAERDAILARLESGETLVVSNVGCLCEGWDQAAVKCAILARPTKSPGLYLQQAGRILRPWNGLRAMVLDHAGCVQMHGLPQDDRAFSLDGDERRQKKAEGQESASKAVRICTKCFAVLPPSVGICPECGFESPKVEVPHEADGTLIEMTGNAGDVADDPRFEEWQKLVATAAKKGFKPGWAYYRFKERYGVAPPKAFDRLTPRPRMPEPPLDKRALYRDLLATEKSAAWATARYAVMTGELPPRDVAA